VFESMSSRLQCPELLAPAGDWDCVKAAVENGADAIYFGLERFNARMRAQNFTEADLPELMVFLHRRGVKGYVTFNTLIFPNEVAEAEQYVRSLITAGVDAAIVQDIGLCRLIRHLSPNFPIHASTQMTITSALGVEFASALGCQLVVLARECSLKDIHQIQHQSAEAGVTLPLEVFVHGALCVAYSGQCLTSEALGGRSANRGECAQACRMPYELVVNGKTLNLAEQTEFGLRQRQYLLSPQDLAGLEVLPELVKSGVSCLKIEGRLKAPEYVASVTRVYRQALDKIVEQISSQLPQPPEFNCSTASDWYTLEMAFSRGLYTGWFKGIDNQKLVHAQFGKKRGAFLGTVTRVQNSRNKQVLADLNTSAKAGDGIVFDHGHPEAAEIGGRIYAVEQHGANTLLTFGREMDLRRVHVGDHIWKTSDPEFDRQTRQTYAGEHPKFQRPIRLDIYGECNQRLTVIARDESGHVVQVESTIPLAQAHTQPLTTERLRAQFGRLGNTPFRLSALENYIQDEVILPVSELNQLRRNVVEQLDQLRSQPKIWQLQVDHSCQDLMPLVQSKPATALPPELIVLVRSLPQLETALNTTVKTLYCEFEDPRAYHRAVQLVRTQSSVAQPTIWVAPPRITKPGEQYILQQVRSSNADGYLIRNYDQLRFFADSRCIGDFSLNVANPITADYFKQQFGLERLTASYDLNITQLEHLLTQTPSDWFEVTIHQHMPMFHMEHCVFCAFLSTGTDFTNCGRPCEQHEVKLRDRAGMEHVLHADAGCRNTVFNGSAQTGAESVHRLQKLGLRNLRIEFVNETPAQVAQTIQFYQQLLTGQITGTQLWKALKLQNQLGVTRGPLN
jgi:U32 family peptidase